jgi:hypothetical protein
MKHLFIFLIGLLLGINSCTKEKQAPPELIGNWQWKITHVGAPWDGKTPENTGVEKLLVLTEDFGWTRFENNITVGSGTFSVGQGEYIAGSRFLIYDSIVYHKSDIMFPEWDYYEVEADTLTFCGCFAGFTGMKTIYVRELK